MKRIFCLLISLSSLAAMGQPCTCQVWPNPALYLNSIYCIGQPFPIINVASLADAFVGSCPGSISYSWDPSTTPTTPGPHVYDLILTKGTRECRRPFILNAVNPTAPNGVEICSPTGNTYTQCCGTKNFRLKATCATGCNLISGYPATTSHQWYIMKKTGLPPSNLPTGTESNYPTTATSGNPCWGLPFTTTVDAGRWYKFGGNGIANIGNPGFRNQDFPVNSYFPPSSLMANSPNEMYYVRCKIIFPGGSFNGMSSGFTNYFSFTVAPPNNITATISSTQPNCGNNGSITVIGASGGTSPYQYALYGPTNRTFQTSNVFLNIEATTNAATSVYYVRIRDANGCIFTINVGHLLWDGPSLPVITAGSLHNIPCNSSIILTTPGATSPHPPCTYQWMICTGCGSCGSGTCNTTNCPAASYNPIGVPTTSLSSIPFFGAGCYKVKVTDPNGGCNLSSAWYVTSANPPIPDILGPHTICTFNPNGDIYTLSTSGAGLQWYLNNSLMNVTTQTVNITVAGTYKVTSTINGCTSTSADFIVTGVACNCTPCTYTPSDGSTQCVIVNGVLQTRVTFSINNTSNCPGNLVISIPTSFGTLTTPGTFLANPGSTTFTFDFTPNQPGGTEGVFNIGMTLPDNTICPGQQVHIVIPPPC